MRSPVRRQAALVALLLLLTIVIFRADQSAEHHQRSTPMDRIVTGGVGSVQWIITGTQNLLASMIRPITHARQLDRTNRHLRIEVGRVRAQLVRLRELEAENERLRKLLDLRDHTDYPSVTAEIIGRNPSNWFDMVIVDRGSRSGIRPQSIVITDAGVVGRVYEVDDFTSKVILLTDPQGAVGGLIQRTRQPGIVEGQHNALLRLRYLPKDANLKKGDQIVTSGLGKVFPPGLPIGRVVSIGRDPDGGGKIASIAPAVDPRRVEQVLILITGAP